MKKLFALFLITSLALAPIKAQDISFGAKAGVNFATLQPDLPDPESKTGFHIGGVAEIAISDVFSVQPELLYSAQGVHDESDDNEEVRLNYLTLPIMAKYYIIEGLSIEAGPQIGFLLLAEFEDNGETEDLKDDTKGVDFGLAFGAGYKLPQGINFAIRYYLGADVNDISTDPDEFKNRVFQISVGYFFNQN